MKIIVTGFEPFDGERINPAYEAVKRLPEEIAGAQVITMELPTIFSRSAAMLEEAIRKHRPEAVLCVGQDGGSACIMAERVAINLADARIPDNDGAQPVDEPLLEDGPAAYFATIPVKKIAGRLRERGIPCQISYSAGTYVCNCVMYRALHLAETEYPGMRAGFIHVPYIPEQAAQKGAGTPSMDLERIRKGLEYAVEVIAEEAAAEERAVG